MEYEGKKMKMKDENTGRREIDQKSEETKILTHGNMNERE